MASLRALVPFADSPLGALALPWTARLVFGSQPVTLTEPGCWVEDTRGLNEVTFLRHSATGAGPLAPPSLRRNAVLSVTPNSQLALAASRLRKSRSDSMLCCRNSYTTGVDSSFADNPWSWTTLLTMSEADIFWKVRLLRPRWSRCDRSIARNERIAALLVNSGS